MEHELTLVKVSLLPRSQTETTSNRVEFSWVLADVMTTKCSCCFQNCYRNCGCIISIAYLPKILSSLLHTHVHPLSGADEVSQKWWQLVTALHNEGWQSQSLWLTLTTLRPQSFFIFVLIWQELTWSYFIVSLQSH
jgi:hypothetical protein